MRRGKQVDAQITRAVARIHRGLQKDIYLGNMNAKRDWGHARDYVDGMWRMLQAEEPEDFVLATGVTTSVRDFVEAAFKHVGIAIKWRGEGLDEVGYDDSTGEERILVRVDPSYFRPAEVELLIGDATKAKEKLDWAATTSLEALVSEMVASDIDLVDKGDLRS
jgi:GDPmannose 4,6-dehydratase